MKRFLAIVLLVLLAFQSLGMNAFAAETLHENGFNSEEFTKAFEQGELELKRLDLPGTENISWISLSPKGSYLFGYQQDVGYGLYDVAQQHFSLLTVDTSGDTYGCLERVMRTSPDYWEVVWSPDEEYFSITNYAKNIGSAAFVWDLYLGDTQTSTLRVLQTWNRKMMRDDFGTAISPCFSEDSCSLYYTFYGNIENERKFQTYEYNLATGENTLLFENATLPDFLSEYFFCMDDGRFLELKRNADTGKDVLYLFYPDEKTWNSTSFEIDSLPEFANVEKFINVRICKIDGQRFALIIETQTNMNSNTYSLLFQINESNQFEVAPDTYTQEIHTFAQDVKVVLSDTYARNIQPSPDGQYFLSVNYDEGNKKSRYGLWVNNTDKKYDGTPKEVKVTLPEDISYEVLLFYCMGANVQSAAMYQGMQWGGDLVLLSPTDVCYFASAKDIPWNKTTDMTGTTWLCITPQFATLRFLENGVFEMTAEGQTMAGEYHWESYDTLGLTMFDETILFVSEGDSLIVESEDEKLIFYLSK